MSTSRLCQFFRLIALSLLVFMAGAPRGYASDPPRTDREKVVLQLTWYHEFQFAGYYAAQLKGYYAEEGLEVEIRERDPERLPVDAVLSGEADFGNATSDIVFLRRQGKPVVVLAAIMQHSPWALLVRADSDISSPNDLIGKTVSLDMSYRDAEILAMLRGEGVPTERMTLVRKGSGVTALANGTVDARASYICDQPYALEEEGLKARVIRPINYGIDFYGDTLFTSESQVREHPMRVAAFRRASLRGWQYAMDHPEELVDYIYSTYYADPSRVTVPFSREHLSFQAKVIAEDLIQQDFIEIGHMNPRRWQRIADTYTELGMGESTESLEGFIYDPNPKSNYKQLRMAIGMALVFLLLLGTAAIVLLMFNRRLQDAVRQRTAEIELTNQDLQLEISDREEAEAKRDLLETQLLKAQKMEAVGQLAGGIAHDFNNLLTAILGYSEMAQRQIEKDSPANRYVGGVLTAGNRAKELVAQLLAFSRQQVLQMENLNLNEVIADLMDMLRRIIGEHITLEMLPADDLRIVRADRGQIAQILTNLCVNASDAMSEGGRIVVDTKNVWIDEAYREAHAWAAPGWYVLLSVTDTGCGMDDEILGQIFEPFFTSKEVGKGTGLGLATVYGLVRQHGGQVEVYSEVGRGTTFKIYLRVVEEAASVVADTNDCPVTGGTETILLAEDNEAVLELCKDMLESVGYTVLPASDGEEALRVFDEHTDVIDLALLDVVMPNLGGRTVFARIRERRPELPALFASGYSAGDGIHTNFILDEGLMLIQKPYQRADLLRKVRVALDRT